jgi:protein-disulfide isomerase
VTRKRTSPVVPLAVAGIAAVALVGVLVGTGGSDDSEPDAGARAEVTDTSPEVAPEDDPLAQLPRREKGDPMALGDVDAPVVMVSYSEFQCPFCGKFARDTEPELVEQYVEDGTLRIEWRDFPYLGQESATAALAGRAAAAQGRFWEFHDAMYADQPSPNSGAIDQAYLDAIAEETGLDVADFRRDMASPQAQQAMAADFAEGQQIGVTGTPAFIINGQPVIGAQPTATFEQVIEDAAAATADDTASR